MDTEYIEFKSGEYQIKGMLHLPKNEKPPVVIGSHGLFSSYNSPKQLDMARLCTANHMAYFRVNHRGVGLEQSVFNRATTLKGRMEDITNAYGIMQVHRRTGNAVVLFGSSMGGTVCLSCASQLKIVGIVSYAAPLESQVVESALKESGELKSFVESKSPLDIQFNIRKSLYGLKNALIVHGEKDPVVPMHHAETIFKSVSEPKQLIILDGGDHPMSNPKHQVLFKQAVLIWLKKCFHI